MDQLEMGAERRRRLQQLVCYRGGAESRAGRRGGKVKVGS